MSKKKNSFNNWNNRTRRFLFSRTLIKKNYIVHGIKRRSSFLISPRIDHLYEGKYKKNFYLHYGDLTDGQSTSDLIKKLNLMKFII